MPIHDWSKVDAGIFHDFHHAWIERIKEALNDRALPAEYYALAEQHASQFGPDVLTLQAHAREQSGENDVAPVLNGPGRAQGVIVAEPKARLAGETDLDFYRRKQK